MMRQLHTATSQAKMSEYMPRIHSKQENRLSLPNLKSKKQLSPEPPTSNNFFDEVVKGQQLLDQIKPQLKRDHTGIYRLVYKSQYSFRPSKLNPRFVTTQQPMIQQKLGGPSFAYRTFKPVIKPQHQMSRKQIKYLDESRNLNESVSLDINKILHGSKNNKVIIEESENSILV
ncbi:hypothetical protein pb186bvf_017647 [Paramecium bursaria]